MMTDIGVFGRRRKKEDPSKVLLNPADPEATFRRKAGKKYLGYAGNIVESVGEQGSIITDYAYEQNIHSDSQFLKEHLRSRADESVSSTMVADGAYGGEHNIALAREHHVNLVTTNFTGRKPADIFADFIFSGDGKELLACIHHKKPIYTHYDEHNERCNAHFDKRDCESCPYQKDCRPQMRKNYALRELSWKAVNRAKQLRYMKTEEFKEHAHFRNGVEAVPSLLRRKYKVDKIPAHGKRQTRFHFGFKIAALNFQKLLDYIDSCCKNAPKLVSV